MRRAVVGILLTALDSELGALYARTGRAWIPAERLLRTGLMQVLFSVCSERQWVQIVNRLSERNSDSAAGIQAIRAASGEIPAGAGTVFINTAGIGFSRNVATRQGGAALAIAAQFPAVRGSDDQFRMQADNRFARRYFHRLVGFPAAGAASEAIELPGRLPAHAGRRVGGDAHFRCVPAANPLALGV